MSLTEADTRAKIIDPALHRCGWAEDLIRREATDRGIDIVDWNPLSSQRESTDYLLRTRVLIASQPIHETKERLFTA